MAKKKQGDNGQATNGEAKDAVELADFTPLDDETIQQCEHMRDAVRDFPAVDNAWLDDSRRELSVYWHEETASGTILCKARVDMLHDGHLVDLKTTRSAAPGRFARDMHNMGYHVSLDYYRHGLVQSGEQPPEEASIVAVEKTDPYLCAVYGMDESDLLLGREVWRAGLELIAAHRTADDSRGGYSERRETIRLPGYAESQAQDTVRRLEDRAKQIQDRRDNPFA